MKLVLDFIKEIGILPIKALGWLTFSLVVMSQIPQLNYIPKAVILYILTPFVMGSR